MPVALSSEYQCRGKRLRLREIRMSLTACGRWGVMEAQPPSPLLLCKGNVVILKKNREKIYNRMDN